MESTTINNNINVIKEVRELFNERRSSLNCEERNRIREKLYNFSKEKGSLTNEQKNRFKNFKKYLKKHSKRFRKYNTTYDVDYLFNELNEPTINNGINAIKEVRELFNERGSNLNREERNRIREKFYNFLKESSLTNKQKNKLKNFKKYLKKYSKIFRKYNTTYDLDYLFNELNKPTINSDINAIKEVRELFNERRSNLNREERSRIREKLYNFLKESSLTNKQKNRLKNLKKDLEKLQKYQYNITYGLDYLFDEEGYEPKEIKSSFDGNCMLYESKGDKDAKLSIDEYFDIIIPYLRDMIDNHKARGEWKIQISISIIFVSFVDANETLVMHTKSDNVVIMSGEETINIINELKAGVNRPNIHIQHIL